MIATTLKLLAVHGLLVATGCQPISTPGREGTREGSQVRTEEVKADDVRVRPREVAVKVPPETVERSLQVREVERGWAEVGDREFRSSADLAAYLETLRPEELEHGIAVHAFSKAYEPRDGSDHAADAVRPFCERRNVEMFSVLPLGKAPGMIVHRVVRRR